MQTGQHLLSAVVDEVAGADTTRWEMHPFREDASSYSACIDLSISSLKPQQMQVHLPHGSGKLARADLCALRSCLISYRSCALTKQSAAAVPLPFIYVTCDGYNQMDPCRGQAACILICCTCFEHMLAGNRGAMQPHHSGGQTCECTHTARA